MFKLLIEYIKNNYFKLFPVFEEHGIHITHNHFYSPIPDTRFIKPKVFNMDFINIDINEQFDYLNYLTDKYSEELPHIFKTFIGNSRFDGLDAYVAYLLIRELMPENIIEIGSGYSTIIQSEALVKNCKGAITCIEPYPDIDLSSIKYVKKVYEEKLENISTDIFKILNENDILFIDSSHVVKTGSDVLKIFTEILPVLNKGVVVHFHDIFLPLDYPISWMKQEYRFWNEQYFLYNFLLFNNSFKIVFSNSYLGYEFPQQIKDLFPKNFSNEVAKVFKEFFPEIEWFGGGSFWIKRV
jgi:hypothetical protein